MKVNYTWYNYMQSKIHSLSQITVWPKHTLLYKMPSNLKGKNFVSKFPGYCPQNTMVLFFIKIRWYQEILLQAIPAEFKCPHILI